MPSAMPSADPRDDKEALVTLTPVKDDGSGLGFNPRRVVLGPGKKCLAIGRASPFKENRNATIANGLFDNPVVSRCHAEVEWEESSQSLFYIDTNSTHGSKINNKTVDPLKRQSLKAGDKITLGNFIHSRDKAFPPLHLQVGLKIGPPRLSAQVQQKFNVPAPWRQPATRGIPTYTVPDDSESDSSAAEPSPERIFHEISDSEDEEVAQDLPQDEDDGVEQSAQMLYSPNLSVPRADQPIPIVDQHAHAVEEYAVQVDLTDEIEEDPLFAYESDGEDHATSEDESAGHQSEEEESDEEEALLDHEDARLDETLLQLPIDNDTAMFLSTILPQPVQECGRHPTNPSDGQPQISFQAPITAGPVSSVFQDLDEVIREQNSVGGKGSIGYILQGEQTVDPASSLSASDSAGPREIASYQNEAPASPDTPSRKRKLEELMIDEIQEEMVTQMTMPAPGDVVEAQNETVDALTQSFASKSLKSQGEDGASSGVSHDAAQSKVTFAEQSAPARKRLRRVAEAVGYATLGGAAVLTALIATAPAL